MTVEHIEGALQQLFCEAKGHGLPGGENIVALCLREDGPVNIGGAITGKTIDFGKPDCRSEYTKVGYVPLQMAENFKNNFSQFFGVTRQVIDIPFICGDEDIPENAISVQPADAESPLFLSNIGYGGGSLSPSNKAIFTTIGGILVGGGVVGIVMSATPLLTGLSMFGAISGVIVIIGANF